MPQKNFSPFFGGDGFPSSMNRKEKMEILAWGNKGKENDTSQDEDPITTFPEIQEELYPLLGKPLDRGQLPPGVTIFNPPPKTVADARKKDSRYSHFAP